MRDEDLLPGKESSQRADLHAFNELRRGEGSSRDTTGSLSTTRDNEGAGRALRYWWSNCEVLEMSSGACPLAAD